MNNFFKQGYFKAIEDVKLIGLTPSQLNKVFVLEDPKRKEE